MEPPDMTIPGVGVGVMPPLRIALAVVAALATVAFGWSGNAAVQEFVIPLGSQPQDIRTGPDRALWFTESGSNKIGRITTDGAFTEFVTPAGEPYAITVGPDGALWFTDVGNFSIGRITTAGAITEFAIAPNSNPISITAGPDGALWFTEAFARKIGRITTDGVITLFPLSEQPGGITAGPDGALWFDAGNQIGRITTAGVITDLFPVPTASAYLSITVGSDGALWFTEFQGNKIGKITTAGAVTEFPIPTSNSSPQGIAAGPDGALWFTESGSNKIGRITTAGVITEFSTPTSFSGPTGIAAGPDGAMWFTEHSVSKIGRICLTATHDLNDDCKSDILWRENLFGGLAAWLMNRNILIQPGGNIAIGGLPANFAVVGQRDFDGDGKTDLLWRDTTGGVSTWLIDGTNAAKPIKDFFGIGSLPPGQFTIAGTGDFNRDGKGDILWRGSTGGVAMWLIDGTNRAQPIKANVGIGSMTTDWQIVGVGDFNGDGASDILWVNDGTMNPALKGQVYIWLIDLTKAVPLTQVFVGTLPAPWSIAGTGDFNGDTKSDILITAPLSDGSTAVGVWLMNGGTLVQAPVSIGALPAGWTIVETGDFNGDRHSDLLLLHAASNSVAMFLVVAEQNPPVTAALGVGSLPVQFWRLQFMNAD
jgi:streptogramin lyase